MRATVIQIMVMINNSTINLHLLIHVSFLVIESLFRMINPVRVLNPDRVDFDNPSVYEELRNYGAITA